MGDKTHRLAVMRLKWENVCEPIKTLASLYCLPSNLIPVVSMRMMRLKSSWSGDNDGGVAYEVSVDPI